MVTWTQLWAEDARLMYRVCPEHGYMHPDPDDLDHALPCACECRCCVQTSQEIARSIIAAMRG